MRTMYTLLYHIPSLHTSFHLFVNIIDNKQHDRGTVVVVPRALLSYYISAVNSR